MHLTPVQSGTYHAQKRSLDFDTRSQETAPGSSMRSQGTLREPVPAPSRASGADRSLLSSENPTRLLEGRCYIDERSCPDGGVNLSFSWDEAVCLARAKAALPDMTRSASSAG